MFRRSTAILIAVTAVASVGLPTAAEASFSSVGPTEHRSEPGPPNPPAQPDGECLVTAILDTNPKPVHDEYTLIGLTVSCVGPGFGSGPDGTIPENYSVWATGYVDGPGGWAGEHEPDVQRQWSWGKGDIDALGPVQCGSSKEAVDGGLGADFEKSADQNYIEFTRTLDTVNAWGQLRWTGGCLPLEDTCFLAVLDLTPFSLFPITYMATGGMVLWDESRAPCQGAKQVAESSNPVTDHRTEPGQPPLPADVPRHTCTLTADVSLNPGLGAQPVHARYEYEDADMTCTGQNVGSGPSGTVPAAYSVTATGYTDGPTQNWIGPNLFLRLNHGETDARGWSWGKGDVDVTDGPVQCGSSKEAVDGGLGADFEKSADENYIEFTRFENVVTAWGRLEWTGGCLPKDSTCFYSVLELTPTDFFGSTNRARLAGEVILWDESVTACQGDKQSKKPGPDD